MLSDDEKRFMTYWEENRDREKNDETMACRPSDRLIIWSTHFH